MDFKIIDIGYEPPKKKKILVVDDEAALQSVVHDALAEDYQVLSAFNGREGLDQAERMMPDLIFMDVMMPDMNGYEVVKMLRGNPVTKDIPVIVITARDFDPSTVQLMKNESNVVGFLPKPFRVADLRDAVRAILNKK